MFPIKNPNNQCYTFVFSPDLTVSFVLVIFCFETSLSLSLLATFTGAALLAFLTSFVSSTFNSSLNSSAI